MEAGGSNQATMANGSSTAQDAPPAAGCSVRCFSEVTPSDGRLDFQIIDLGRQVYVWVALGGAKMGNLCFSIASPAQAGAPATAVLLRGNTGASGEGLAQRLAIRLKRPVLCSCNIPQDMALLQVVAERRLLRELLGDASANGGSSGGSGAHAPAAAAAATGLSGSGDALLAS